MKPIEREMEMQCSLVVLIHLISDRLNLTNAGIRWESYPQILWKNTEMCCSTL